MYPSSSDDDKPLARNGNRTNGTSQLSMMVELPSTHPIPTFFLPVSHLPLHLILL
ncbi:hypothetical protein BGX38DRAFT_1163409 [Terfezia claveryi]|nr:hypothetical protein BGX38DRAFT_1163409 [Terfezia claveryi]